MSDTMLFGVLKMPFEMAMRDEMSRIQFYQRVQELVDRMEAQPEQEPVRMPCIGKDPRCPCQDGDACHYKDCGNTKAWPVPQAEPTPWRDMVVVTLVREGIDKHRARELADHFAAQPEQEPLGWLDGNDKLAQFMHRDLKADHDKRGSATPREYTIPVYAAPPKRPWVGLTASTILNLMPSSIPADHDGALMEFARATEAKLKELNT